MILFSATSRRAVCLTDDPLTVGSVGLEVQFQLAGWDTAPARVAVFTAGQVKVDVALSGSSCALPPEVLATAGETLVIGLYGTGSDGEIVIPTIYAEAGRILPGAAPSGIEPTPQTQPLIDQLLEAAEDARDLAQSVRDDADNGAFDGAPGTPGADGENGNIIWWTSERPIASGDNAAVLRRKLHGPDGLTPAVGDYVFGPAVAEEGEPTTIYVIITSAVAVVMTALGSIKGNPGSDGYAPVVTIEQITGGHRITITSAAHPEGQVFDVMDGQGGSVTVDDAFSAASENPVQNKVITSALNYASQQLTNLGLALDDKVDKVSGKGLSTNDFTDSDKDKLDGAATETWVQQQGYLTGVDLAPYRTAAQQDTIDDAQDAAIAAKYTKPANGIPATDLASAVQNSLVFACTYGTTTSAEIEAAYQAGKDVIVTYNSKVYRLVYRGSATSHTFSYFNDSSATTGQQVFCSGDTWSAATAHELIRAPGSATVGDFLCFTSNGWDAVTVPNASGVSF